jgi:transporter family-2 protein
MAGVTVVIGRIINSSLAEKIGTLQGTLINYLVGLFFSVLFLFLTSKSLTISTPTITGIPVWAYFGGAVGVAVVLLCNYITPRISTFYSTLLMFVGQLFVGIILDYIILKDLSIGKLIGGILVLTGLIYNLRVDKKQTIE